MTVSEAALKFAEQDYTTECGMKIVTDRIRVTYFVKGGYEFCLDSPDAT